MEYVFNIAPKENIPTIDRRAKITMLLLDTVKERITINCQVEFLDINGVPFGNPENFHNLGLVKDTMSNNAQTISEELATSIAYEKSVIGNPSSGGIANVIRAIFAENNLTIID